LGNKTFYLINWDSPQINGNIPSSIGHIMDVRDILERYSKGEIGTEEAERLLKLDFLERIGDHTLFDHSRSARKGIPEIIFGESKDPDVLAEIVEKLMESRDLVIISRTTPEHYNAIKEKIGERDGVSWAERARMVIVDQRRVKPKAGTIGIMAAGTSDIAVAEEAREVAEIMGCTVITAYDVGIAALHRVITPLMEMMKSNCEALVVVAGMEGALASVVSGLVDVPVIGVPCSVGYGKGGRGEAALISMLQSCSPGLVVVNIDNGINAGATAALISKRRALLNK
jgi:NCAIR mutase (PurE)-related protein